MPNVVVLNDIRTVSQLLALSEEQLEKLDIGLMNLICAQGLNGSEDLDIEQCLATLDEWAEILRKDMEKRLPLFPQYAAKYDNSINLYKVANIRLYR